MNYHEIIDRIKQLNIPARAKSDLLMLWHKARNLAEKILAYLEHHREFAESILLGAIVAFVVAHIPWIGGFLALCTLVTAAAIGVMRQLRRDLEVFFQLGLS